MKKITALILSVCIVSAGYISSAFNNVKADESETDTHWQTNLVNGMVQINGTWRRQTTFTIHFDDVVSGTMAIRVYQSNPNAGARIQHYHIYNYDCGIDYSAIQSNAAGYLTITVTNTDFITIVAQNTIEYNTGRGESYLNFDTLVDPDIVLGSLWTDYDSCIVSSGSGGSGTDFEYNYNDKLNDLVFYSTAISTAVENLRSDVSSIEDSTTLLYEVLDYLYSEEEYYNWFYLIKQDISNIYYGINIMRNDIGKIEDYMSYYETIDGVTTKKSYLEAIYNLLSGNNVNFDGTGISSDLTDLNTDINSIDSSYQSYDQQFNNNMTNVNNTIEDVSDGLQALRTKSNIFYEVFLNSSLSVLVQDYRLLLIVFLPVIIVLMNFFLGRRH